MRILLHFLPLLLFPMGLPAFPAETASPAATAVHRTQVLRPGKGQPRVQGAAPATPASRRTMGQAVGTGRTRAYQAAKPGEGEPKT